MSKPRINKKDLTQLVLRPEEPGRLGRPINVYTNFYKIVDFPGQDIIHYDVTITPDKPALNMRIFRQFEDEHRSKSLGGAWPVFDGKKNLFSPKPLPFGAAATFEINLKADDGSVSTTMPPRLYKITIQKVAKINMEELSRFVKGQGAQTPHCLTAISALNVLIQQRPSMLFRIVRGAFYLRETAKTIPGGVEIWQGYFQSVRPSMNGLMINIDVKAAAFYQARPLVDVATNILGYRSPNDIKLRDRYRLEEELKGLWVCLTHRGERKIKCKIENITTTSADNTTFKTDDGNITKLPKYFLKRYNKKIVYGFHPCIVAGKDRVYPMEFCDVIEGQLYIRKLDKDQKKAMIDVTCQPPNVRAAKIAEGLGIRRYKEDNYMKDWNMKVNEERTVVKTNILPPPSIQYHPSSHSAKFIPNGGAWNLQNKKVVIGMSLSSWTVVVFSQKQPEVVNTFIRELIVTCQDTGMNIVNKNPPIITRANPVGNISQTLNQAWQLASNAAQKAPQLILCVLPNKKEKVQLYAMIKQIGDTSLGVATQCVLEHNLMKPNKPYCANVCLKINYKLGGTNWVLDQQQVPFISEKSIIFGADVTHPGPGDKLRPSIAVVCASVDKYASRYSASIRNQRHRKETITDLSEMVRERLEAFKEEMKRMPDKILFYRDGVSEGQFLTVKKEEVAAIKAACASLDREYKPTLTYVVVQKRHHAKFFPMKPQDGDRKTGNCLPGTSVESGITHPFEFDFYLQSHAALKGTSKSCHYHVIHDENKFTSDKLKSLSYHLCYLQARCTRSVSLVPPVYYADMICTRARYHCLGETWSHGSKWSSESQAEKELNKFAPVKVELQKVGWYI